MKKVTKTYYQDDEGRDLLRVDVDGVYVIPASCNRQQCKDLHEALGEYLTDTAADLATKTFDLREPT